eukprot:Gb_41641 [translate_table: standard]
MELAKRVCNVKTKTKTDFSLVWAMNHRQCSNKLKFITPQQEGQRLKEEFDVLDRPRIQVELETYGFLLHKCSKTKALLQGKLVHAHMLKTGIKPNTYVETKLVIMYVKCGSLVDARSVLNKMQKHNVFTWTAMIGGYAKHGYCEEAIVVFRQMQMAGVNPCSFAVAGVLPACANSAALEHGRELHAFVIQCGFESDVYVSSCLVDLYAKCGILEDARIMFDKMSERNVVSWNAVIAGYAQKGHGDEALHLFRKMQLAGVKPDLFSWNTMIAGCAQNGRGDEALKLFRQMQLGGVKPDAVAIVSILPACTNITALEQGKGIHAFIIGNGFDSDVYAGSALVDMYAKCGSVDDARRVFDEMLQRNVVSWSAMIAGCARHGHAKDALELFSQMKLAGVTPNHVTFTGVLSACSHAGLVDEGWQHFNSISQEYRLTPSLEHYACMVDLLGRSGHLDEACDFIAKMPSEPDLYVWGALLGACRIHCNVELAEHAAEHLFELDPENTGNYVLLSNIYAAAGRWDNVTKLRRMMNDKGLRKRPAGSWIEVKSKVHSFLVGDRSHPQRERIYSTLENLAGQMKEAGYAPETNFVLRDVEEEEKEHILCGHSEKLAIAFGLINECPGKPLRVIKNLRVCDDCHIAIKFISKIVGREIFVRDANRYHHFKDGLCSCRDYW